MELMNPQAVMLEGLERHHLDDSDQNKSVLYNMSGPKAENEDWVVPEIGSTKPKTSFLDPTNWRRSMLTEEEALEKFFKRSQTAKYMNARFKCVSCYTNFARREKLEQHYRVNHDEDQGSHVCRLCKRRFQKACKLRMHMKKHYLQIQCLRCNMVFNGEGLAFQHEEFHRGVSFSCKYCEQQFRHKSTYYQHVRTRHRSAHVCDHCGASFGSHAGLNVHRRRTHYHQNKSAPSAIDNYYCKKCDIKFVSVEAYNEHYRHSALHADDNGGENICGVNDPKFKQQKRQPMNCSVCKQQFLTVSACVRHHKRLHADVPLPDTCVDSSRDTRVHCEVCGAYIKESSMYTHMNAHTRHKVYTCARCGAQFPYPTSLARHQVTHTGEKKYPCSLCDKRFTQRNSMTLHYRTYHLKEPYPKRNRSRKKQMGETEPNQTNNQAFANAS